MERTLVLCKPDAVQRRMLGAILTRFEQKGLHLAALRLMQVTPELAREHYRDHAGKHFYDSLVSFITAGPVLAMVLEGEEVISVVRGLVGTTNGRKAAPGTIRGDFGMSPRMNLIHASDSPESATREIALFFGQESMLPHPRCDQDWIGRPGEV